MKSYATIGWTPNDLQDLAPKMTEAEATVWLEKNEQRLKERLCELGWEQLLIMLKYDGVDTADPEIQETPQQMGWVGHDGRP